ncbi:MAG: class I SAM-dependent DNA methyltransferase [Methanosarcinaceae archaeon]
MEKTGFSHQKHSNKQDNLTSRLPSFCPLAGERHFPQKIERINLDGFSKEVNQEELNQIRIRRIFEVYAGHLSSHEIIFFSRCQMKNTNEESLQAWEANADYWDSKMGDNSNYFHCHLVRPNTEKLLDIKYGDFVLDIACGNGNFSQRLAKNGAIVVAFDYSTKLIEHAKKRRSDVLDKVEFCVCDATDYNQLLKLKRKTPFNKAVSNMAIMDISDIEPLFKAVYDMLSDDGIFVFSTHHPCFTHPEGKYLTPCLHKGEALRGQPLLQNYYHRSLQKILNLAFNRGFVLDKFFEVADDDAEMPILMTVRLIKLQK